MFQPKVSIIIPVYNGSNFLAEAINSALDQDYKNIEIVVINDGSTDDGLTKKVALSYGEKIIYVLKENGGVATALNTGIKKATGEYISWLSHDDLYEPSKLKKQVELLNHRSDKKSIISSDYELIDENGKHISFENTSYTSPELLYKLLTCSFLNGCSLLIAKECYQEVGGFDEKLKTTQDYQLWFRMMKKYSFVHLEECLVKSRQHSKQDTLVFQDTVIEERKALEDFVFTHFHLEEIKRSSGIIMPDFIFKPYLFLQLKKPKILQFFIKIFQRIGIYGGFSRFWRKFILKVQ